ncbi:MAG TPA: DsbA family protein [Nitrospirales bacterium]|jgi:protein-disulfide isomerase
MFRTSIVIPVALMGALLLSSPLPAEESPYADPAWQQAVEKAVESYIRSHPEVIEQTLQSLEAKRQTEELVRVKAVIADRQNELLNDPTSPVSGNLKGDVTVVEFFDYRCGFCKRVAPAVTQLQKDDPRVRVVYKDLPILGEASETATKAALASRAQGKHQAFHEALMASKEDLSQEKVLKIAAEVGLDATKIQADMANPDYEAVIERNRALARGLGIGGTPAFVIGNEFVPGTMDLNAMKELVARVRNAK